MLLQFSVGNFLPIKERQTFGMVASKLARHYQRPYLRKFGKYCQIARKYSQCIKLRQRTASISGDHLILSISNGNLTQLHLFKNKYMMVS